MRTGDNEGSRNSPNSFSVERRLEETLPVAGAPELGTEGINNRKQQASGRMEIKCQHCLSESYFNDFIPLHQTCQISDIFGYNQERLC